MDKKYQEFDLVEIPEGQAYVLDDFGDDVEVQFPNGRPRVFPRNLVRLVREDS